MNRLTKVLARDVFLFALAATLLVLTWQNDLIATLIILALFLVRVRLVYRRGDFLLFLVAAFFGAIGEIIATHYSVWSYANPTFFNIPLWLPIAWGVSAVCMAGLAQEFIKKT